MLLSSSARFAGLAAFLFASAFTPMAMAQTASEPLQGMPYRLASASYEVSARYEIIDCPHAARGRQAIAPRVRITTTVTTRPSVDRSQSFVFSPMRRGNWSSSLDASIAPYPNGALHTLNVKSEDRTAAILSNIISTIVSIATLPAPAPAGDGFVAACQPDVIAALVSKTEIEARLLAANLTEAQRTIYEGQIARIVERRLTFSASTLIEPTSNATTWRSRIAPSEGDLARLFTADALNTIAGEESTTLSRQSWWIATPAANRPIFSTLSLDVLLAPAAAIAGDATPATDTARYLVIRPPAPGVVYICRSACGPANATSAEASARRLAAVDVQIPQLGRYFAIPLLARSFQNRTLSLTLGTLGEVEAFGYVSNARGEALSGAISDATRRIVALEQQRDANEAARDAAEASREVAAVNAETSAIEARIRQIEAQRRLDALIAAGQ